MKEKGKEKTEAQKRKATGGLFNTHVYIYGMQCDRTVESVGVSVERLLVLFKHPCQSFVILGPCS